MVRTFELKDGWIRITYQGKNKLELGELEKQRLNILKKTLMNVTSASIKSIIVSIRLIMQHCNEEELTLSLKGRDQSTNIKFNLGELTYVKQTEAFETSAGFKATYKKGESFECSTIGDKAFELITNQNSIETYSGKYNLLVEYTKYITNLIQDLNSLSKISERAIKLCEIYKLFYDEDSNFSNEETSSKFQAMMYILSHFQVVKYEEFKNSPFSNKVYNTPFVEAYTPASEEIKDTINYILPMALPLDTSKINIEKKDKIKEIGKIIREATNNDLNELAKLNIILYLEEQSANTYENETVKEHYSDIEIDQYKKVLKSIETKINS